MRDIKTSITLLAELAYYKGQLLTTTSASRIKRAHRAIRTREALLLAALKREAETRRHQIH